MLNLSTIELWLILQVGLEALLVILMLGFYFKIKRMGKGGAEVPENLQNAMDKFLAESEKLSSRFTETLEQKKEISVNLLLKLERKINDMNRLLEKAEQDLSEVQRNKQPAPPDDKSNPAAPENRALVKKLAERGLSVEEIARKAKLHKGEVELIIDLEKQFEL